MLRKIYSIFIILIAHSVLHAESISINQVETVAQNFIESRSLGDFNIRTIDSYEQNNQLVFYYVNFNPHGYILISADNRMKPILAYSYNKNFIIEDVPENIQWILNHYYQQQQIIFEYMDSPTSEILEKWNYYSSNYVHNASRDVSPLIEAEWNQDYSWNRECPEDSAGPGGHVFAGCVAVAAAQLMHYWEFPESGNASKSYNHNDYGELSVDFEYMNYDFSLMPNTYSSQETEEFLFHIGVAYSMNYGPEGSGTSTANTLYALPNFFSYNDDLQMIELDEYDTQSEYEEQLILELDNQRPVIYRGCGDGSWLDDGGCHAWNVDGYEENNSNDVFFHCNWGWGGQQNGYFSLGDLTPQELWFIDLQNFNLNQGAVIGVQPRIGCMDEEATNYDETAGQSCDSCCDYCENGVIGELSIEFDDPYISHWHLYYTGSQFSEFVEIESGGWGEYSSSNHEGSKFCIREEGDYYFNIGSDTTGDGGDDDCGNGITFYQLSIGEEIYIQGSTISTENCVESYEFVYPMIPPDTDGDGVIDSQDNCPDEVNEDQSDYDEDNMGDICDFDDDNDGVIDLYDPNDNSEFICGDVDDDACDDCSSGMNDVENDGIDFDGDGLCNEGDIDDDNDGWIDLIDNCPDLGNPSQSNYDGDDMGDSCDFDDDNDGVVDLYDSNDYNEFICGDVDEDGCDDCSSGYYDLENDCILEECNESDCNGNGSTDDPDNSDGCNCECDDGWGGDDCSYILGDINLDGQTNVQDVVSIVSYVLGQMEYSDEEYILSDYNQDGEVNVQDVVAIVSYILSN